MIYEFYRVINFVAVILLALFFGAIQSVFLKVNLVAWLELDILLLLVTYLSLHRGLFEGAALVIIISRIAEIHSSAPSGVLLACYFGVFLAIFVAKEMLLVSTSFSSIILSVTGGLVWKAIFLIVAYHLGFWPNVWKNSLEYAFPFLLGLGLASRYIFDLMHRLDGVTKFDREADSRQLASEDF
jgi:hypothetical protein